MKLCGIMLMLALMMIQSPVFAGPEVERLQKEWAIANYQLDGDEQENRFRDLAASADQAVSQHPDDPELLIWQGIIKSTWAGKAGGLSALGLVKEARASLERAIALDGEAMSGSAYTSLGALYYQVPGWPIAFGSDKKARKLLEKAIELNPDGIDANYFYGEFLFQENQFQEAMQRLEKALNATPRAGRDVADSGRRQEIRALLQKVQQKLGA